MSREKLIEMTEHNIAHSKAGTIDMEPEVFKVPAEKYYDEEQYKAEVDKIFKRGPAGGKKVMVDPLKMLACDEQT